MESQPQILNSGLILKTFTHGETTHAETEFLQHSQLFADVPILTCFTPVYNEERGLLSIYMQKTHSDQSSESSRSRSTV